MTTAQRTASITSMLQRRGDPGGFTPDGSETAINCISEKAGRDELEYIPDGGRNAADADLRIFLFAPSDAQGVVADGTSGVWGSNGERYTVLKAAPDEATLLWRAVAFRSPVDATTPRDIAQKGMWK